MDGHGFEWIADADSRLGPLLEVILEGKYYWAPFCRIAREGDDERFLVVRRGETAYAVLNLYPYAPGHLMVCPYRHVADYTDTTPEEASEIAAMTKAAMHTLRSVSHAEGFNVGINQGRAGGGALAAAASGHLSDSDLAVAENAAVTVVLTAGEYPAGVDVGSPIDGIESAQETGALVFHAGTALKGDRLVTNGGRILNVTATGDTVADARERAYAACEGISFPGMRYRRDIAAMTHV